MASSSASVSAAAPAGPEAPPARPVRDAFAFMNIPEGDPLRNEFQANLVSGSLRCRLCTCGRKWTWKEVTAMQSCETRSWPLLTAGSLKSHLQSSMAHIKDRQLKEKRDRERAASTLSQMTGLIQGQCKAPQAMMPPPPPLGLVPTQALAAAAAAAARTPTVTFPPPPPAAAGFRAALTHEPEPKVASAPAVAADGLAKLLLHLQQPKHDQSEVAPKAAGGRGRKRKVKGDEGPAKEEEKEEPAAPAVPAPARKASTRSARR